MLYLLIKAGLSGVIVTIVSEVAKRFPGFGALIASLPLVSVLGMMWLWRGKTGAGDKGRHPPGKILYVVAPPPEFLPVPRPFMREVSVFGAPVAGCAGPGLPYPMV